MTTKIQEKNNKPAILSFNSIFIDYQTEIIQLGHKKGYVTITKKNNQWVCLYNSSRLLITRQETENHNEWIVKTKPNMVIRKQLKNAWEIIGKNTYLYIRKQDTEWHIAGEQGDMFVFDLRLRKKVKYGIVEDLMLNQDIKEKIASLFIIALCELSEKNK